VRLPARFQLLAAMNPCPCGYYGDAERACRCTQEKVKQYQQRISGPMFDRIDMQVEVARLSADDKQQLLKKRTSETLSSQKLRAQVVECRAMQMERSGMINARLEQNAIQQVCALSDPDKALLNEAMTRLRLSTRAYFKILKIARTIADLATSEHITRSHLFEAINYRRFDVS
ncbi:MAG: ATP-binding protein, partial [Pseudomonadota bacterium]